MRPLAFFNISPTKILGRVLRNNGWGHRCSHFCSKFPNEIVISRSSDVFYVMMAGVISPVPEKLGRQTYIKFLSFVNVFGRFETKV